MSTIWLIVFMLNHLQKSNLQFCNTCRLPKGVGDWTGLLVRQCLAIQWSGKMPSRVWVPGGSGGPGGPGRQYTLTILLPPWFPLRRPNHCCGRTEEEERGIVTAGVGLSGGVALHTSSYLLPPLLYHQLPRPDRKIATWWRWHNRRKQMTTRFWHSKSGFLFVWCDFPWNHEKDGFCHPSVRLFVLTSNFNVKANPSKSCNSSCISRQCQTRNSRLRPKSWGNKAFSLLLLLLLVVKSK